MYSQLHYVFRSNGHLSKHVVACNVKYCLTYKVRRSRQFLDARARFLVRPSSASSVPKIKIPAAILVGVFVLRSHFPLCRLCSLQSAVCLPSHRRINASQIKLRSDAFMTELCPPPPPQYLQGGSVALGRDLESSIAVFTV